MTPILTGQEFKMENMEMSEEDITRYKRLSSLLNVIIEMQSHVLGVTLSDIQRICHVSRRTAERFRDAILNVLPQVDEIATTDREKHWGFTSRYLNELAHFSSEEIATLESIKNGLKFKDKKQALDSVIKKLKAISKKNITNIEDTIEFVLKTEGIAVSQKLNYKIDINLLEKMRTAIKENRKIRVTYRDKEKVLSPLGIIYGNSNIHLIALEGAAEHPYNYALHRFSRVEITLDKFERKDFDIKEYANRSFGIYQNKIMKVELLFDKDVREDVLNHYFHPTQKITENPDGSVTVKFNASGSLEIIWHLFKWSDNFKLIAPKSLKDEYIDWLQRSLLKQIGK